MKSGVYFSRSSKKYSGTQRGYTLLELMISTTLGLIIMAGVVQMYASSRTSQIAVTGTSRIQENARYIFNRLEQDIGRTGLLGCLPIWSLDGQDDRWNIVNLLGNATADGQPYGFFQSVAGLEGGVGVGPAFADQLSLRFASPVGLPILNTVANPVNDTGDTILVNSASPLYSTLKQWQIAVLTDCDKAIIFIITNDPTTSAGSINFARNDVAPSSAQHANQFNACEWNGSVAGCNQLTSTNFYSNTRIKYGSNLPAMLYSAQSAGSMVYTIGTSAAGDDAGDVCSDDNPQYCALFVNSTELVDGVEDFQVQFGEQIGLAANTLAYVNQNNVGNWGNVRSIRVTITLNSVDRAGMGAATDGLLKQTFTRTFNMYNMQQAM